MLLAKKTIGPADVLRYIVDYCDWLDQSETISVPTVTVDPSTGSLATVSNVAVSPDGKSFVFYLSANSTPGGTQFNANVEITTVVGGVPPGQTKFDHVQFNVVAA